MPKDLKTAKKRIAIFLEDRVDIARSTRDWKHLTIESIMELLDRELPEEKE